MLCFYLMLVDDEENKDKLSYLYQKYYSLMCAVARQNTYNASDVEDIVHNSILKIIPHLHKLDLQNETATRSYICTVVANKARDENRRGADMVQPLEEVDNFCGATEDVLSIIQTKEGYELLVRCIHELSPALRRTCELRLLHDLTEREIADLLDTSVTTVGVRIMRGRAQLKKRILEEWINI